MIKQGDSVKIDYTGTDSGRVFDTTNEDVAKKENIFTEKGNYESVTIIIGAKHVLNGLEKAIIGKKKGDKFEVEIDPEDGFGKREGDKIKLVPMTPFKKDKVKPYTGMVVNIDGAIGTVKSVSGGRVIVDFNHPLSGKKLKYKVTVLDIVTGKDNQLKGLFKYHTGKEADIDDNNIIFKGDLHSVIKSRIFEDAKKWLKINEVKFVEIWK